MHTLAMIFLGIGCIIILASGLNLIGHTFRTSTLWGIAALVIPGVICVYTVLHWEVAKRPFLLSLLGIGIVILAVVVDPSNKPAAPHIS